jgi:FkbM family methyltransferase
MQRHIKRGSVAYDIGANYGIHTLLMGRLAGRVYAFEPVPRIFDCLEENVQLNGFSHVSCLRIALSDHIGVSEFHIGHHAGAGHLADKPESSAKGLTVTVTTLDHFVYDEGQDVPTFLKIDVEGAESKVLHGAERVLREARPVMLIDLHSPDEDRGVGAILKRCNYSVYRTATMEQVADLSSGWPTWNGIWGQVIALG